MLLRKKSFSMLRVGGGGANEHLTARQLEPPFLEAFAWVLGPAHKGGGSCSGKGLSLGRGVKS